MILKLQLGITIFSIAVATAIYFISLVIYRLYLSPLAKFPGPKLAAATSWYEFYHDFWRNGQYIFEIEKMHRKYGPIIRVNPEELSIHDPSFYNQLYVTESKRRTSSYETFCKGIEIEGSHLLTVDHDLHRRRRKPLESFFSRRGLTKLEHIISEVTLHLESRFKELKGSGKVIRLDHACSAFSGDIIGRICLGGEPGQRFLDDSSFASDWYNVIHAIGRSIPFITGLPVTIQMLRFIPERLVLWAYPEGQMFIAFKQRATQQIQQAKMTSYDKDSTSVSLFAHIIRSDLPESEKSDQRLSNEAQVLLGAGTATAGHTITFASFYILSRPAIRRRLASELENTMAGWPNTVPTWAELEKLPFLQAIIKESLRLSYGVMHRLPRVSPDVPIQYKEYTIPIGVPVGMSAYLMHSDPNVYPSPKEFLPERWLGDVNPAMNKSYVPFCRGSRNCLGMNLAMAEISLILAVLYRSNGVNLELFDTDETDVIRQHDFLIPVPKLSTKGVRVMIR